MAKTPREHDKLVTVRMPSELHRRAQAEARRRGETFSALARRLVAREVERSARSTRSTTAST